MSPVKPVPSCIAIAAMAGLLLFAGRGLACMVCIPFPEDTVTDRLLRAEVVVLAREDESKPFSYAAIEVLKGEPGELEPNLFVDSATRRRLGLDPALSVVLTFDRETREWRSNGFATPRYRALVEEILARSAAWNQRARDEGRARFFLPYLADTDPAVQQLAYLEIGQASYDTIRLADPFVPAAQVHRFLADPAYLEWHALYILLLGIDARPGEAEAIRKAMQSRARSDSNLNLGAWSTALIEIDGAGAIDWLESVYLDDPGRDPNTVLEVVKALSVQGTAAGSAHRGRIAESYAVLVRNHPTLAGWAARDLTAWKDWRFADAFVGVRAGGETLEGPGAFAVDYYVGQARSKAAD